MNREEIDDFQKQDRIEQMRRLVGGKIKNDGYTLEDFKMEYQPSELDILEFKQIQEESGNV